MSGVIVRLKSGVEGLSRCRIASTEHMFSMGATDISTDVASLLLGVQTGDAREECCWSLMQVAESTMGVRGGCCL
jgi:hypothetical protein